MTTTDSESSPAGWSSAESSDPVAGLARDFARREALSSRSPARAALRLVVTAAALAVVVHAVSDPPTWYVWPALWVLTIGAILSCGAVVHEAAHRHLFSSKWANYTAGMVCSSLLGAPFVAYRDTHMEHHRFTHQIGDTDPLDVLQKPYEFVLGLPVYGFVYIYKLYAIALAALFGRGPTYSRGDSRALAAWSLLVQAIVFAALGWSVVAFGVWPVVVGFVVPWMIGVIGFLGVIAISEHYEMGWGPAPATATTRSVHSNAVVRFAYWNTNYHCEHHLVPHVPCWNLRAVHDHLGDEVTTSSGYTAFAVGLYRRLRQGDLPEPCPGAD